MIEELLPTEVEAVATRGDVEGAGARLYPAEAEAVARAVPKRRNEYATGRLCAHRALARLGAPPGPLLRGERGAPGWPEGTLGSLTHCADYRAAAVARRRDIRALGIDAEPHGPLPDGVLERITVGGETGRLERLAAERPQVHWGRVLFSAKESVYKAWNPMTGRWLGFSDAELDFVCAKGAPGQREPSQGTFTARLLVPGHGALTGFHGRWAVRDGLVVTAVTVREGPGSGPGHGAMEGETGGDVDGAVRGEDRTAEPVPGGHV